MFFLLSNNFPRSSKSGKQRGSRRWRPRTAPLEMVGFISNKNKAFITTCTTPPITFFVFSCENTVIYEQRSPIVQLLTSGNRSHSERGTQYISARNLDPMRSKFPLKTYICHCEFSRMADRDTCLERSYLLTLCLEVKGMLLQQKLETSRGK